MKRWGYLLALLIVLEILSGALYLSKAGQPGFPLDDAWIHQTYARNLELHGLMAFSLDQPSTGSTSPGWTTLLAAGYILNIPFYAWAYVWGSIFAVASAYTASLLSYSYFGDFKRAAVVGVICIIEWHLAWAALSGMEISLFIFLILLTLLLIQRDAPPILMGLIVGLAFLVRPEGAIFAFIYGLKLILANRRNPKRLLSATSTFAVIFLIVISPWVIFNLTYNGRPFPSTISSKFMQYGYPWSAWTSPNYLLNVLIYFLEGPFMLLVPGAGIAIYDAFQRRETFLYYPLAWFLSLIGLYAVALPAIYHHGRYLMPLIPILAIFGTDGLFKLLEKLQRFSLLRATTWLVLAGMLTAFWINGASTFALQIRLLTASHMQAARWVAANSPMTQSLPPMISALSVM